MSWHTRSTTAVSLRGAVALALAALLPIGPVPARADGIAPAVAPGESPTARMLQRLDAALLHDGKRQTTILSITWVGGGDFAWIVPVPRDAVLGGASWDALGEGDQALERATQAHNARLAAGGVDVEGLLTGARARYLSAQKAPGQSSGGGLAFEPRPVLPMPALAPLELFAGARAELVAGDDPAVIQAWLRDHGCGLPPAGREAIATCSRLGGSFLAVRVSGGPEAGTLRPVCFHTVSNEPVLPLSLGAMNSGVTAVRVRLWTTQTLLHPVATAPWSRVFCEGTALRYSPGLFGDESPAAAPEGLTERLLLPRAELGAMAELRRAAPDFFAVADRLGADLHVYERALSPLEMALDASFHHATFGLGAHTDDSLIRADLPVGRALCERIVRLAHEPSPPQSERLAALRLAKRLVGDTGVGGFSAAQFQAFRRLASPLLDAADLEIVEEASDFVDDLDAPAFSFVVKAWTRAGKPGPLSALAVGPIPREVVFAAVELCREDEAAFPGPAARGDALAVLEGTNAGRLLDRVRGVMALAPSSDEGRAAVEIAGRQLPKMMALAAAAEQAWRARKPDAVPSVLVPHDVRTIYTAARDLAADPALRQQAHAECSRIDRLDAERGGDLPCPLGWHRQTVAPDRDAAQLATYKAAVLAVCLEELEHVESPATAPEAYEYADFVLAHSEVPEARARALRVIAMGARQAPGIREQERARRLAASRR